MSELYATMSGEVPRAVTGLIDGARARNFRWFTTVVPDPVAGVLSILEIGPGLGDFADRCRNMGWNFVGIEAGGGLARALRRKGLEVIEAQVPPLPPLELSVDVLYAAHVVEHLHSGHEVVALLEDARRILRPGSRIVLIYPSAPIWGDLFWEVDYTHHWPASARRLRQAAADAGLIWRTSGNRTLGLSGGLALCITLVGRCVPWRISSRLPPNFSRALVGLRALLMPESFAVLEVP